MELKNKEVFKLKVITIKDFAEKRECTIQAIHYAMKTGAIDYVKVGFETLIVMTEKTSNYLERGRRQPNKTRLEL